MSDTPSPKFLGVSTGLPTSPDEAELDYVANPRVGQLYLVRFAAPEFTSLCPVTGQPDWASVSIRCRGPKIDEASLLRYLVSFRQQNDFHEQCVEQIFCDIQRACHTETLTVFARYLRRGGLDINPWRGSSEPAESLNPRAFRQ